MDRLRYQGRSARRAVALTLVVVIVLAYGALAILVPGPLPADSTIVPLARVNRVAVDGHSANDGRRPGARSAEGVHGHR